MYHIHPPGLPPPCPSAFPYFLPPRWHRSPPPPNTHPVLPLTDYFLRKPHYKFIKKDPLTKANEPHIMLPKSLPTASILSHHCSQAFPPLLLVLSSTDLSPCPSLPHWPPTDYFLRKTRDKFIKEKTPTKANVTHSILPLSPLTLPPATAPSPSLSAHYPPPPPHLLFPEEKRLTNCKKTPLQ